MILTFDRVFFTLFFVACSVFCAWFAHGSWGSSPPWASLTVVAGSLGMLFGGLQFVTDSRGHLGRTVRSLMLLFLAIFIVMLLTMMFAPGAVRHLI